MNKNNVGLLTSFPPHSLLLPVWKWIPEVRRSDFQIKVPWVSPEVGPRLVGSTDHWHIPGHGGTQMRRTHTCVASRMNPQPGRGERGWVHTLHFHICLAFRSNFSMPRWKELWSRYNKILKPWKCTEVYRRVLILLKVHSTSFTFHKE